MSILKSQAVSAFFAAFLALFFAAHAAEAHGVRVALIIGNSHYVAVGVLANPVNDAADVAQSFADIGFEVTHLDDLTGSDMRRALRDFENKASGAQIAVVYYAGHGVEVDGVNYLIPVDATLERDTYVEDEAIPLSRVMTSVDGATGLRLVLLDACRNNPFVNKMQRSVSKRSIGRGLARIEPTGSTLVAYSAKEGTTAEDGNGRNSPYATALVANLKTPGLEVNFLFRRVRDEVISSTGGRQEPFVYGSLGSTPIYFVPAEETPAEPEVKVDIKPSITSTPSSEMAGAYDRAERINTLDAWDTFLEFCGAGAESGGIYCGLARAARQKLANASSGSSAAPRDADAGATGDTKLAALSDPAAKSTVGSGNSAAECDRFAAHPDDADRPASVAAGDGNALYSEAARAIEACSRAVDDNPGNRRYLYQYGRALAAGNRSEEALTRFTEAAGKGSAAAMSELGILYETGAGTPVNLTASRDWYVKAAEAGNIPSMTYAGYMLANGRGGDTDYAAARSWYEKGAALGNAASMTNLGFLYASGWGVDQSWDIARQWYDKGAEAGNPVAMWNLGVMYEYGSGVTADNGEAFSWYYKAANAGNAPGMYSLGQMYEVGKGVAADDAKAFEWYEKAANAGNAQGMTALGVFYTSGRGVARDDRTAFDWFTKGANLGNAAAMWNLGLSYEHGQGVTADENQAFYWYGKGAEAGHADSMAALAYFYSNGKATAADVNLAFEWYQKAAELGSGMALHNLGVAYKDGIGTKPNFGKASDMFIRAMQARNTWTFDQFRDQPGNYPPEVLRRIQRYLIDGGYLTGSADGVIGKATKDALDAYQREVGG